MHPRRFALPSFLAFTLAALPGLSSLSAQVTLPYTVDFEPSENFSLGNLQGQAGWQVEQGRAFVGTGVAFSGTNAVTLAASTPPTAISQSFTRFFGEDVTFVDFYALPVADGNSSLTTRMDVEAAQAGFFRVGEQGEVYALDGDGQGGGQWLPTDFTVPLGADGRAREWIRFTFRQDFTAKLWDLYLDGALVMADLHFRDNTVNSFSRFRLRGAASADSYFDYFYASADNPLFADQDKDGIDDAWELAHGLDPTVNDRNLLSGKLTNLQRYLAAARSAGATGTQADTKLPATPIRRAAADAVSAISGLRLRLQADAGVTADGSGFVSTWADQSGLGKNATQTTSGSRPTFVTNVLNGNPVIRFSGGQYLNLPNLMSGATAGEVFLVIKAASDSDATHHAGLEMGTSDFTFYPLTGGQIRENFGTTAYKVLGDPVVPLNNFNLYNIGSKSGEWTARFNGAIQYATLTNTVSFSTSPNIGNVGGTYFFNGDIAEIIIYDHVLTTADRDSVGAYLNTKYALGISTPAVPASVTATAVSSTQVNLTWADNTPVPGTIYSIERQTGAGAFSVIAEVTGSLAYFDTGLTANTSYTYRIKARTYAGDNGYSSTASVTTLASATDFPLTGQKLWLRADAGVPNGVARVQTWFDQSAQNYQASSPLTTSQQPALVTNVINGRPVIRFSGGQYFSLPNLMSGATAGEVFLVIKAAADSDASQHAGLEMGTSDFSFYPLSGGPIRENFGTTAYKAIGDPVVPLNNFNLYNVASKSGEWTARFNGATQYATLTNTVGFSTTPNIGNVGGTYYFNGDIAEIIIYDHVLTAADRDAVGSYLNAKYALGISTPAIPTGLTATAVSSTQVNLAWTDNTPVPGTIYSIERQTGAGSFAVIAEVTGSLGYFDPGLTASTSYTYRIKARTYAGTNGYSGTASVTTPAGGTDFPLSGQKLWLRADAGVPNGAARVQTWYDQSAQNYQATSPLTTSQQPSLVTNVINGRPVIRFSGGSNQYFSLPNLMSGATAGEVFMVIKAAADSDASNHGALQLGSSDQSYYPLSGGQIRDNFGTNAYKNIGDPTVALNTFNLYNVASKSGEWTARLNGAVQYTTLTNTVSFPSSPNIGNAGGTYFFNGDIAEIIIYDHVLTVADRDAVGRYLCGKYALGISTPAVPGSVTATAVSPTQANLTWADNTPVSGAIYSIERQTGAGAFSVIAEVTGSLGYFDSGLTAGTSYGYRIKARSYAGDNGYSSTATVTTPASGFDLPLSGQKLWLRADSGVPNGAARIGVWFDQSGLNYQAVSPLATGQQPTLVTNAVNGRPVVHFVSGSSQYFSLPNLMSGATAGEYFIVVKATSDNDGNNHGLVELGTNDVSFYPQTDGQVRDNFGTTAYKTIGNPPPLLNTYNLYNVSATSGEWAARFNGILQYRTTTNTVSFATSPNLGLGGSYYFAGDVAELIVYDHVLQGHERLAVSTYLTQKYALNGGTSISPTGLVATIDSPTQVRLSWTGGPNDTFYVVERRVDTGSYSQIAEVVVPTATYTDSSVPSGSIIQYRLRTYSIGGASAYSNVAYALMSPDTVDSHTGLTYRQEVALGLDPTVDNSATLSASPYPPDPPPTPDPSDHTSPVILLDTPSQATLF